ncbi:hypothetical protein [Paraburkholderia rhizosphaerae]|uniref:Uncharacterized protein n=1 Tax=Paraburkholderia rhizosphaerae TaxID=480658 RepID=A0A4R8KNP2_9BURK|nr:hypothetical protein [Paraburkholderia rhizosphaerae]TDY31216.1 hypothetical protein BX592_1612 [Paraburkholderia rhizosphaerae]
MKIGRSVEIFNPYEWLPGYGESDVTFRTEGGDLVVTVAYDGENGLCERELCFTSVCSFYVQSFPGPSMVDLRDGEAASILRGALVEYPDSEAAIAWTQHYGGSRVVRHYGIVFLAENRLLVALAEGAVLRN